MKTRTTKHRQEILKLICAERSPIAADTLFLKGQTAGFDMALSTVYRTLDYLESNGAITKTVPMDGSKAIFELAETDHHHHMICLQCKSISPLPLCPLSSFERKITKDTGFVIQSHRLELYGTCANCANAII